MAPLGQLLREAVHSQSGQSSKSRKQGGGLGELNSFCCIAMLTLQPIISKPSKPTHLLRDKADHRRQ